MVKIVILNGPPRVGKDTLANYLVDEHLFTKVKFADRLKAGCHALLGLNDYGNEDFDAIKDMELKLFFHKTPRDFYIHIVEKGMKEFFGQAVLGDLLIDTIQHHRHEGDKYFVVSDSGFMEELRPLIKTFGSNHICVLFLAREGCNFKSDSRSYLPKNILDELGVLYISLTLETDNYNYNKALVERTLVVNTFMS